MNRLCGIPRRHDAHKRGVGGKIRTRIERLRVDDLQRQMDAIFPLYLGDDGHGFFGGHFLPVRSIAALPGILRSVAPAPEPSFAQAEDFTCLPLTRTALDRFVDRRDDELTF